MDLCVGILTFDPNATLFFLQRHDLVAIGDVIITICAFGCDRWDFCYAIVSRLKV